MRKVTINGQEFTTDELRKLIEDSKDWRESELMPQDSDEVYYMVGLSSNTGFAVTEHNFNPHWPVKSEHKLKKLEDAKKLSDKCMLMLEMTNFAIVHNDGWVADWKEFDQDKFGITASLNPSIDLYHCTPIFTFGIAVKSREIAEKMLEEFRDKLGIYLL